MKYVDVVYKDEIDLFISSVEEALKKTEADKDKVLFIEEFLYEFEKFLTKEANKIKVMDLRSMKNKEGFFPKK